MYLFDLPLQMSDFQVLLASNGTYSRLVYNYDQTRFRIKPSPGRKVVIGYSNGTFGQGIIQFNKGDFTDAKHNSNIGLLKIMHYKIGHSAKKPCYLLIGNSIYKQHFNLS